MYLLGRGELYLTLIDHLHTTMKGPPTTVMSYGKLINIIIYIPYIGTFKPYMGIFKLYMVAGYQNKN